MSYFEDFQLWKEQIENLTPHEVKPPNQPVDEFVSSTEALAIEANKDRDVLTTAGMDPSLIDNLVTLSGALRYCEAQWKSEYLNRIEAQQEWQEKSPMAYELKKDLLHHFSFAYRKDANIQKKVMRIREGTSHADMVQDLIELAVLGEKYPEPLTAINFDLDQLQAARRLSHAMSELLAAANGSLDESNGTKQLRDKAFSLLYKTDSAVREYGRYVFWKDEDKRKRYYR